MSQIIQHYLTTIKILGLGTSHDISSQKRKRKKEMKKKTRDMYQHKYNINYYE